LRHIVASLYATAFTVMASACVVTATPGVSAGYGYGYGYGPSPYAAPTLLQQPTPVAVASMPPDGLDERMPPLPGVGFVWINGYWHWNGYEWAWVSGRFERQQEGYVYVEPYHGVVNGVFVYTPGYWSRPDHLPPGWVVQNHSDGQPKIAVPPPGWHMPNPPAAVRPGNVYGNGIRTAPPTGVYPSGVVRPQGAVVEPPMREPVPQNPRPVPSGTVEPRYEQPRGEPEPVRPVEQPARPVEQPARPLEQPAHPVEQPSRPATPPARAATPPPQPRKDH
jgi:hypothetical protein